MIDPKTAAAAAPAQRLAIELKVSGHLMTLDAGLFCVFNTPGSAPPDAATGFPGVRLSVPPGPAFHPEAVTISSFRDDGWLGGANGAALVRVTRGPAQVLVTIYQAPNSTAEAPKLQILRLTDGAAPPPGAAASSAQALPQAPAPAVPGLNLPALAGGAEPGPAGATRPPAGNNQNTPAGGGQVSADAVRAAEIIAHVQGRGDVVAKLGEWMGEPGSERWIEGFALSPKALIGPGDIEYQAVLGRGWLSPWSEGGQYCGSRGMSLPILGLRVRLRGQAAEKFDCAVETSFVDGTRIGPLDNGEPYQAESLSPLEAFKIVVSPRKAAAPKPAVSKTKAKPAPAPVKPKKATAPPPKPATRGRR